jgi:hypothetical protein
MLALGPLRLGWTRLHGLAWGDITVGLCTLNQVDP